jgi:DNA-binding transcriptional regulator LsrR (DeoR family)
MPRASSNPDHKPGRNRKNTKTGSQTSKTGPQTSPPAILNSEDLREMEKASVVAALFCKDYRVSEILAYLKDHYGDAGKVSREGVYAILRRAGVKGWFRFQPPPHLVYAEQLRRRYGKVLQGVEVVWTTLNTHVASQAARTLLELVKDYARRDDPKKEVHIGFAGGISIRHLAAAFAQELWQPSELLPEKIVFHSMNAGFDPRDHSTDPNAFVSYFVNEAVMQTKYAFVGLRAPSMVLAEDLSRLKKLVEIEEAYKGADDLDIIVTSGADWDDPDNSLRLSLERYPDSKTALEKAGCVGDMLWRPLAKDGPIETETAARAMTLIELSDLPDFIHRGNHVLLVMGPCGGCNRPKGALLQTILNQKQPLVTHIVVDSRTAGQVVRLENLSPLGMPNL